MIGLLGNKVTSRFRTSSRHLRPQPSPMIDRPAATDRRDFCSRERHAHRRLGTDAESVNAWQDTYSPDRPAHQADHSAYDGRHFMNAHVPDATRYVPPDYQAGQCRCTKTPQFEPRPGAILRGQLSPTRITNAAVKSIGIANGNSTLTKKVGGTIGREAKVFVTTQSYRTVGLRNR